MGFFFFLIFMFTEKILVWHVSRGENVTMNSSCTKPLINHNSTMDHYKKQYLSKKSRFSSRIYFPFSSKQYIRHRIETIILFFISFPSGFSASRQRLKELSQKKRVINCKEIGSRRQSKTDYKYPNDNSCKRKKKRHVRTFSFVFLATNRIATKKVK